MLPQIIVSTDINKQEDFIQTSINEQKIEPFAVFRIAPDKKELGIDKIRELKKELILSHKGKRLYIIESFDRATTEAQNAFLKTLEEKNQHNLFILLVKSIGSVLPTVLSRSRTVVLDQEKNSGSQNEQYNWKIMFEKPSYSFLADPSLQSLDQEKALVLVQDLLVSMRHYYRDKKNYGKILKKILASYSLLQNNNANAQLTVDTLLIFTKKMLSS